VEAGSGSGRRWKRFEVGLAEAWRTARRIVDSRTWTLGCGTRGRYWRNRYDEWHAKATGDCEARIADGVEGWPDDTNRVLTGGKMRSTETTPAVGNLDASAREAGAHDDDWKPRYRYSAVQNVAEEARCDPEVRAEERSGQDRRQSENEPTCSHEGSPTPNRGISGERSESAACRVRRLGRA
jgi:hypothetical protein